MAVPKKPAPVAKKTEPAAPVAVSPTATSTVATAAPSKADSPQFMTGPWWRENSGEMFIAFCVLVGGYILGRFQERHNWKKQTAEQKATAKRELGFFYEGTARLRHALMENAQGLLFQMEQGAKLGEIGYLTLPKELVDAYWQDRKYFSDELRAAFRKYEQEAMASRNNMELNKRQSHMQEMKLDSGHGNPYQAGVRRVIAALEDINRGDHRTNA